MSATNFVIKKNDGTTDVTYTALASSAGDKAPALWTGPYLSGYGSAYAHKARLTGISRMLPGGKVRQSRWNFLGPNVHGTAAPYTLGTPARISLTVDMPEDMDTTAWYEAVSQALNSFKAQIDLMRGGNVAP